MKFFYNDSAAKYFILFVCVVFSSSYTVAQKNFKSGNVVLENGTALSGWIDYRNWNRNPEYIHFKKDSISDAITRFHKNDLQSFVIQGQDAYQRAIVSKDMRSVEETNLENHTQDIQVTDTVFLRILVKSPKLSLFELIDEKRHYFISDRDGEIKELEYKIYTTEGGDKQIHQETYKYQLKSFALNTPESDRLTKKIERAQYKAYELASIVSILNGDNNNVNFLASSSPVKLQLSASIGAIYSKIKFQGSHHFKNIDFRGNLSPSITLAMDFFSERNLQSSLLRFELSYRTAQYSGTGFREYNSVGFKEDLKYDVSQNTLSPGLDFLYKFRTAKKLSIYGGIGASYNLSSYPKNKYVTHNSVTNHTTEHEDYISFEKAWISGKLMAGTIINKKIEAGVIANLIGTFLDMSLYSLNYSAVSLNIGYRF